MPPTTPPSATVHRTALDDVAGEQDAAAEQPGPERGGRRPGERHRGGADLEGDHGDGEPEEGGHQEEEQVDDHVHAEDLAGVLVEDAAGRGVEALDVVEHARSAPDDEEEQRRHEEEAPDHEVVGGTEEAGQARARDEHVVGVVGAGGGGVVDRRGRCGGAHARSLRSLMDA
jgi:hypothetical protein